MRHQLPSFSVPMPGAKVDWPFDAKDAKPVCSHRGGRKVLVKGLWLCSGCQAAAKLLTYDPKKFLDTLLGR